MTTVRTFYNKYRNIPQFNKNLIISWTVAFLVSAAFTELYSKYDNNDFWISIVSILTGFSVSIPLFAFLLYMDNKRKYTDSITGKINHTFRNLIMKKLVALNSISNIVNIVARFIIIYELLKLTVEPYESSMLSSLCASGLSYLITNLTSNSIKLFNSKEDNKRNGHNAK